MSDYIITADAGKVAAAEFHKLLEPRRSELDKACIALW